MSRMNRDSHDIVYDILDAAGGGLPKTRIMQKANMSHSQLEKYLELLETRGFIKKETVDDREIWRTTEKGLNAVEACKICRLIVRENDNSK